MNSTSLPPQLAAELEVIQAAFPGILGERYLTAIGLTALLWDHFLTLKDEVKVIWVKPFTLSKAVFVFLRYGVSAAIILVAYVTAGFSHGLTNAFCKRWLIFTGLYAIITMCVAGLILIKRVYTLWDHRHFVLHALIAGFVLSYMGVLSFGVLSVLQILKTMQYDPIFFHSCIISTKPHYLSGLWASLVAFDVYVFVMTFLNAAERPRRVETEIVSSLNRDGVMYFFILFALRLMNLIFSLVSTVSFTFLAPFFVWAMVIVTISRLTLQLENIRFSAGELAVSVEMLHMPNHGSQGSYDSAPSAVRSPGAQSSFFEDYERGSRMKTRTSALFRTMKA